MEDLFPDVKDNQYKLGHDILARLKVDDDIVKACYFDHKIYSSETKGSLFYISILSEVNKNKKLYNLMKQVEEDTGHLTYHIQISPDDKGNYGKCVYLMYTSCNKDDWQEQRELAKNNLMRVLEYTVNDEGEYEFVKDDIVMFKQAFGGVIKAKQISTEE